MTAFSVFFALLGVFFHECVFVLARLAWANDITQVMRSLLILLGFFFFFRHGLLDHSRLD